MEIHKPKPWHGWRELAKEIGTIMIGVLLAIGAEQTVEALRHRAEAEKLKVEGEENRGVVAYDLKRLHGSLSSTEAELAALAQDSEPGPLEKPELFKPADAAWTTIRDSALLPIMPKGVVDNAWKMAVTNDYLTVKSREVVEVADQADAALATLKATPKDPELIRTSRLRLSELRIQEDRLIDLLDEYRRSNEKALRGEPLGMPDALKTGAPKPA